VSFSINIRKMSIYNGFCVNKKILVIFLVPILGERQCAFLKRKIEHFLLYRKIFIYIRKVR